MRIKLFYDKEKIRVKLFDEIKNERKLFLNCDIIFQHRNWGFGSQVRDEEAESFPKNHPNLGTESSLNEDWSDSS